MSENLPITRCPHCGATFNVRPDQLRARQGYVRCGSCRGVFHAPQNYVKQDAEPVEPWDTDDSASNPPTIMPAMLTQRAALPPSFVDLAPQRSAPSPAATAVTSVASASTVAAVPVPPSSVAWPSAALPPAPSEPISAHDVAAASEALTQFPARSPNDARIAQVPEVRDVEPSPAPPSALPALATSFSSAGPKVSPPTEPTQSAFAATRETAKAAEPARPIKPLADVSAKSETLAAPSPSHPNLIAATPSAVTPKPVAASKNEPDRARREPILQKEADPLKGVSRASSLDGPSELGRTAPIMDKWFELDTEELETRIENTKMRLARAGLKADSLEAELQTKMRATTEDSPPPEGALRSKSKHERNPVAEFEWKPNSKKPPPISQKARIGWSVAATLAVVALLGQALFLFRHELAAALPPLKPHLASLCQNLGCEVRVPRRPGALALVGPELQADPAHRGLFVFSSTLRNAHSDAVEFPAIVLALNGLNDAPLARKILTPKSYVPGNFDISRGLPGLGEVEFKVFLDASTTSPVGFSARPTYVVVDSAADAPSK